MRPSDRVEPISSEVLSDNWGNLVRYQYREKLVSGQWCEQVREAYDRGHGVCALLHDPNRDTVLLTRQFRLPVFLSGEDGPLIEVPAGLLDGAEAGQRMAMELEEETGFRVGDLTHLFDLYMSPGSVTEHIGFFVGEYSPSDRKSEGGGLAEEGESIEVIEMAFDDALAAIGTGDMRDAKTVILLQHLALKRLGKSL
jgi:nudix-type nucleoside diphosphatase (YffH/AdpP family)